MTVITEPSGCITGVAKAITNLLGIPAPECASASLDAVESEFGGKKVDRVFIYNTDAVALWIYRKHASIFSQMKTRCSIELPLFSVMPSVTPVCFASMYTGAMPKTHGIRSYTKPVLKTDTVFDAALRAGKKCAIVSTEGDSVSKIFLEREMDYFIYETEKECNSKAAELIKKDEHDIIVLYNGNYDAQMHRFSPEGEPSLRALDENAEEFVHIEGLIRDYWQGHTTLLGFCPDHGCHEIDGGMGSHGLDMPEDMEIIHFYEIIE